MQNRWKSCHAWLEIRYSRLWSGQIGKHVPWSAATAAPFPLDTRHGVTNFPCTVLRMHNTAFGLTRKLFSVREKSYRHVECPMGTLLYSVPSVYLASHKQSYEWNVFSLFVCKQRKRLGNNWTMFFDYTIFWLCSQEKNTVFVVIFFSRQTFDKKAKVLLNIDPLNYFFELWLTWY